MRRAARGFASLRVYFHCRVFFCQVRSAAKLVRESADVWLRFGRAGGNRAPRSTCSPAGVGEIPLLATGRHVCAPCGGASLRRGLAARLGAGTGAKRCWGRPTVPNAAGAACMGVEGARAPGNEVFSLPESTRHCCWLSAPPACSPAQGIAISTPPYCTHASSALDEMAMLLHRAGAQRARWFPPQEPRTMPFQLCGGSRRTGRAGSRG